MPRPRKRKGVNRKEDGWWPNDTRREEARRAKWGGGEKGRGKEETTTGLKAGRGQFVRTVRGSPENGGGGEDDRYMRYQT